MALSLVVLAALVLPPGDRQDTPPTTGEGLGSTTLGGRGSATADLPPAPDLAVRQAIERALNWLAEDLSSSATGAAHTGDPHYAAPTGVTALTALAFMAGGSTPRRGPHQRELARQLDYLLSVQHPPGEEHEGYIGATGDHQSRMHGHGLALLAFTQAYTLSPESPRGRRLAEAIRIGVRRVELAQGPDGGWYYEPEPWELTEGSVTVCLLWALRGARNVGFEVDEDVVSRALAYVHSLQEEDGGFIYSKQQPTSSVALTAACLSTLHAMGEYEGAVVEEGYAYVWHELARRDADRDQGIVGAGSRFPYYERLYLAQSLWQHRDPKVFRSWADEETLRVLRAQDGDGSWRDRRFEAGGRRVEGRYGKAYATAATVLFLSVPEGLLPIYQR